MNGSEFWDKANKIYTQIESFAEKQSDKMKEDYRRKLRTRKNEELEKMLNSSESPILKSLIFEEMKRRGM